MVVSVTNAAKTATGSSRARARRPAFLCDQEARQRGEPTTLQRAVPARNPRSACGDWQADHEPRDDADPGFSQDDGNNANDQQRMATSRMGRIFFQQAKMIGPEHAIRTGLTPWTPRRESALTSGLHFKCKDKRNRPAYAKHLTVRALFEMLPSASVALHQRSTPAPGGHLFGGQLRQRGRDGTVYRPGQSDWFRFKRCVVRGRGTASRVFGCTGRAAMFAAASGDRTHAAVKPDIPPLFVHAECDTGTRSLRG